LLFSVEGSGVCVSAGNENRWWFVLVRSLIMILVPERLCVGWGTGVRLHNPLLIEGAARLPSLNPSWALWW